ncbi:MAG: transcription elongation factor subunit Spt4 [Candidatus Thalassarchaeaceae archaeon]|jgi:DNA-directed RNA polymerase subunit E"|nr:transcription elongation factor subunit Spt4 [Candidatus Thalassarchaeaceae archaeon]
MVEQDFACAECHQIVEAPKGNLGWWLKSNNDIRSKTKKALVDVAFASQHGKDPTDAERKAWMKEHKDDMEKVKPPVLKCPTCPNSILSHDWQGFTIVLNPARSEVARALGIDTPGNYALKVNVR